VAIPNGANIHSIGLLYRARRLYSSTLYDIDWYLDSNPLEWDENDKSNYHLDWLLKWWKANAF
jgi:hypothetical protein